MRLERSEGIKESEEYMTNRENAIGFVKIQLEETEKSQIVLIDSESLENTIAGLRKMGFGRLYLRVENEKFLFITDDRNGNKKKYGIAIANMGAPES